MTPETEDEQTFYIGITHLVKAAVKAVTSADCCARYLVSINDVKRVSCNMRNYREIRSSGWRRVGALTLLTGLLLQLVGCGLTSLTNGSIPEGKSTVKGRVIAAGNSQMVVANVPVTITSTPIGEPTKTYRAVTDAQGQFVVKDIITGLHPKNHPLTITNAVVTVDTKSLPYQPQKVSFLLTESQPTSVVLALPPTGFDLTQVGSVSLNSSVNSLVAVVAGNKFSFTAELLDRNNSPITSAVTGQVYVPNLVLNNLDITDVGANGNFQATGNAIGISSISASISLPGGTPPILAAPVSVPVANSQTVITNTTPQINQGVPAPPFPP